MKNVNLAAGVAAIALVAGLSPAFAQDATATPDMPAQDTIIVTGSRGAARTIANSPVPVDVLSNAAITEGGQVETNKILNKLVPSFNFPQPAISDGSDALRPATLRGLSPDQTLVLVNGKRRHVAALLNINGTVGRGAAAVDMNAIPALALDRIEVLRDGAASQYGSDAIAGVINVRLKTASSGGRITATYGQFDTTLDGVANVTGLQTNAAGQPILNPNDTRYLQANVDGERKTHDGRTYTASANVGLPFFGVEGGYINLTAEYRHRGRTNRQGYDLRPNYAQPTTTTFDSREVNFNRLNFRYGDPVADDYVLFANIGAPVGDWDVYAFASFDQRDSVSAANFRQQSNANNRDYSVLAPNQAPNFANLVTLTPDGFLPLIKSDYTDYAGTIGIKGDLAGWRTDLSFGYGNNNFQYRAEDTVNASLGRASGRNFDAGGLRYGQYLANLDIAHDYDIGFDKPITVAFGAEYRREEFGIRPGEPRSYVLGPLFRSPITGTTAANCAAQQGVFTAATGLCTFPGRSGAGAGAQGFPGLPASARTAVHRSNVSGYGEVDADPVAGFSVQLAGRYEHYSDFGDTVNGKFAARYEFVPGFAVRGAVSTGFRAPSLQQQFFTTTSTNFIGGVPVDVSTVAVNSPLARALGSTDLKPEKTLNLSGGVTASPLAGLSLSADYYNITIRDRIVLTENLGAGGGNTTPINNAIKAVIDANGFPSVGAARFFINGLKTRTQGVDVVASYRLPLAADLERWSLTAAYNYNTTKILRYQNGLGPLAAIPGVVLFGRTESIRFTDGQPRDKVVLSLDGDVGPVGITARTTRYGKVIAPGAAAPIANPTSLTDIGPDDVFLGAKWITDLELRFRVMKKVQLAVGADNLFDVYPDTAPFGVRPSSVGGVYPVTQQFLPYSNFSPFGFNGRFLYGRVSYDF